MNFDFADQAPKMMMLLWGLVAFAVVVGGLLFVLDAVPSYFARRREAQVLAAYASGGRRPGGPSPARVSSRCSS